MCVCVCVCVCVRALPTVSILEVGSTFDFSLEEAFLTKALKYQPLVSAVEQLGYMCQLIVFIFGSLGKAHRPAERGLQTGGENPKQHIQIQSTPNNPTRVHVIILYCASI